MRGNITIQIKVVIVLYNNSFQAILYINVICVYICLYCEILETFIHLYALIMCCIVFYIDYIDA